MSFGVGRLTQNCKKILRLEKVFLKKNIVVVSFFFKTVLYTHILNTYLFN